jgi:hypothetical protein
MALPLALDAEFDWDIRLGGCWLASEANVFASPQKDASRIRRGRSNIYRDAVFYRNDSRKSGDLLPRDRVARPSRLCLAAPSSGTFPKTTATARTLQRQKTLL